MQKILVTGGSGYIGSSVRERLNGRFSFINYDIRGDKKDDVLDLTRLCRVVRGTSGVLHLAAVSRPKWGYEDPHRCIMVNVAGTLNVLEAVRRENPGAWVILGSSREVFGNQKKFPANETALRIPLNAYAVSKVAAEDMLKQFAANYGLRCLTLRFCGVYTGKKDILDRVVPRFILQSLRGSPLTIEGDGSKKFDFVHIDDTVRGIERAMRFLARQEEWFYNDITLARQKPISLRDLAKRIVRLSGSRSRAVFQEDRAYDQRGFWGTYKKAKKILGWVPRVSLDDGLSRAIQELKEL